MYRHLCTYSEADAVLLPLAVWPAGFGGVARNLNGLMTLGTVEAVGRKQFLVTLSVRRVEGG